MSAYYDLYQNPPQEDGRETPLHARILPRGTISAEKFLELVAASTGFSTAILDGTLQAITDQLQRWLADGWNVEVGELGYFSVSLKCDRPVMEKKEIRSPSIHFQSLNLRLSAKMRSKFALMELERFASPYARRSDQSEEKRLELLQEHLQKHGCITRADYMQLTGLAKKPAISDLNRYIADGVLRRYGSGKMVVYLKNS